MEKLLQYPTYIELYTTEKEVDARGEGVVGLDGRSLTLQVGETIKIAPYFQILGIHDEDYAVNLYLHGGEAVKLSQLGYDYESFLLNLYKRRSELLLRYMLMNEKRVAHGIEAHFQYIDEDGDRREGECEVRVYESALVVLPHKGEPIRLPLCYIGEHEIADYVFTVSTGSGETLKLGMMGERTDYLVRSLNSALDDMLKRAQMIFEDSDVDPRKTMEAATLLGDGKASSRRQIEAVSPELWSLLEKRLEEAGLGDEYTYLSRISKGEVWVGVKRGLMGDMTGEYVWFMVPIYDSDPKRMGNALVLEAASGEDAGRATYFFRLMSRPNYSGGLDPEALRVEAMAFTEKANRCMVDVNFRREPIIMPMERLTDPEYEHYLYAANKLPSLKLLRERYIGRVVHRSGQQWRRDAEELLLFNVESKEDSDKWRE